MAYTIHLAFRVLFFVILIRCILSWVPDLQRKYRSFSDGIDTLTDPILKPFQRLIPPRATNGIDFSPIIAIFVLQIAERFIMTLLGY